MPDPSHEHYTFLLFWSDEDDCYVAKLPEFGAAAFGDTPEEALREAQDALAGCIEVYRESGQPLPRVRSWMLTEIEPGGVVHCD